MEQNYSSISFLAFKNDLKNKQFIGILKDVGNQIQGFTTYAINPFGLGTSKYNILFSGDTIISPTYWGSQELVKGWCKTVGGLIAGKPEKKWYWFLLSKGHRTYMYLPLFFEKYYPALNKSKEADLFPIINKCANAMYGSNWNPDKKVITFDKSHGELKKIHIETTLKKVKSNVHIDFFLQRNPGFENGDELTCMAELNVDNMKRFTKNIVLAGMKNPIHFEND
tara:strand:- start:7053 stop:7724 length:672 start_codon:yes stop_codon:yes gene_type:complete